MKRIIFSAFLCAVGTTLNASDALSLYTFPSTPEITVPVKNVKFRKAAHAVIAANRMYNLGKWSNWQEASLDPAKADEIKGAFASAKLFTSTNPNTTAKQLICYYDQNKQLCARKLRFPKNGTAPQQDMRTKTSRKPNGHAVER